MCPDAPAIAPPAGMRAGARWEIRRNCSLTPTQTLACYGALFGFHCAVGAAFWWMGYPWIPLFIALELAALATALLVFARHAVDRETLTLREGRLAVERHCGGHVRRWEFQAAWVRVEWSAASGGLVTLSQCGRRVRLGRHLQPRMRGQLAHELSQALAAPPEGWPQAERSTITEQPTLRATW